MKEATFKVTGLSPILFNNVNSMDLQRPKSMKHAEFESSQDMMLARLYLDSTGKKLIIPPRVFLGMLKKAAQKCGIKQTGKRSNFGELIKAVVFIPDEIYLDQSMDAVEIHSEYVTVVRAKVKRNFPMLREWSYKVTLIFDERQIDVDTIAEILQYGGSFIGQGDYRPQFGRFRAEVVKK